MLLVKCHFKVRGKLMLAVEMIIFLKFFSMLFALKVNIVEVKPVIHAYSICQIYFIHHVVSNESGLVWVTRSVSSEFFLSSKFVFLSMRFGSSGPWAPCAQIYALCDMPCVRLTHIPNWSVMLVTHCCPSALTANGIHLVSMENSALEFGVSEFARV